MLAANKVGVKKLAVLYCAELAQCQQAVPFFTAVGKKYGVDVPFSAAVSSSAPNYLAQCLAAKDAGADGLFIAATSTVSVRVAQNCAEQGYTPHLVTSSGAYSKDFAGTKGSNGNNTRPSRRPHFSIPRSGHRDHDAAFNTYEPAVTKSPEYTDQAVLEWASGVLIADAVKAGKVVNQPHHCAAPDQRGPCARLDQPRRLNTHLDVHTGAAANEEVLLLHRHRERQVHHTVWSNTHVRFLEGRDRPWRNQGADYG